MAQVLRTYFDKNNTIVRNTTLNTGRNPITELFYGGDDIQKWSRFIFYFDTERLKESHNDGTFPDLSKMNHTLKITNTASFDDSLLNGGRPGNKERTSSFDLILFRINQNWDEGVGYDFTHHNTLAGDVSISTNPSNWVYAETNTPWNNGSGIYTGAPSSNIVVATQHFDKGNEDIEMDVTDEVNGILTGGTTNHGYGIAFARNIETLETDHLQYVGFFTRHTHTAYEPFIESIYNETIQDDRHDFFLDKQNKLYLYSNLGGEPTELDEKPEVEIYDHEENLFASYPQSAVTHVTKGVYSIDVTVPSTAYTDCFIFNDKWKNIKVNGVQRPDITLDFPLRAADEYFNIGANDELPKDYSFTVSGIKSDERIVRGDVRKVFVHANIPFTVEQKEAIDGLQYRLYVKEGRSEYTVIDYQDVERATNYNFFILDTQSLIPNTYYLDLKAISNDEVRNIKDVINFDIVGLSEFKESK